VAPEPVHYLGLRFSADGNYIYFVRSESGSQELEFLYRAPVLGGTPQRLITDIDSNITFSPDGRQYAYVLYNNPDPYKYRLIIHSLEGNEQKILATGPVSSGLYEPTWSPDGKTVVCYAIQAGDALTALVAVDVATGKQQIFFSAKSAIMDRPLWLPNGRGLLALSKDQNSNFNRQQIIYVSYPDGKSRPVTHDVNNYSDLSISADGHTLASVLNEPHWELFVTPTTGAQAEPQQVTTGAPARTFTWTHDNQLIVDQQYMLSVLNPASGAKSALMSEEGAFPSQPASCPDGQYLVFALALHGGARTQNIWRSDPSGGNPKQLTDGKLNNYPVCSPDGHSVLYSDATAGGRLFKVAIDGGTPQNVSDLPVASRFDISPDGKTVAFATLEHLGEHEENLALVAIDTGKTAQLLKFERPRQGAVHFSRDGKAIIYPIRNAGIDNLWQQNLDGTAGKQLTNFKSEHIGDQFGWSADGTKLAVIRGHIDSDVVLLRDTQP
jgi:Tol biopolymer transport system component